MTHPDNEFGDFEQDFQNTPKAAPALSADRIPPGTYKMVCCEVDAKSDGKLVDHLVGNSKVKGTKFFKLFLEVVEPAEMPDQVTGEKVKTKGKIVEATFWVTQATIGQLKRDIATILGRDLKSLSELTAIAWLGKTCEVGVKDETYNGFTSSRPNFFNAWKPQDGTATPTKPETKAAASAAPAGGAAPGKEAEGDPDF